MISPSVVVVTEAWRFETVSWWSTISQPGARPTTAVLGRSVNRRPASRPLTTTSSRSVAAAGPSPLGPPDVEAPVAVGPRNPLPPTAPKRTTAPSYRPASTSSRSGSAGQLADQQRSVGSQRPVGSRATARSPTVADGLFTLMSSSPALGAVIEDDLHRSETVVASGVRAASACVGRGVSRRAGFDVGLDAVEQALQAELEGVERVPHHVGRVVVGRRSSWSNACSAWQPGARRDSARPTGRRPAPPAAGRGRSTSRRRSCRWPARRRGRRTRPWPRRARSRATTPTSAGHLDPGQPEPVEQARAASRRRRARAGPSSGPRPRDLQDPRVALVEGPAVAGGGLDRGAPAVVDRVGRSGSSPSTVSSMRSSSSALPGT